jgi:beta-lactamase superfamily II metal-dependent hydrolase
MRAARSPRPPLPLPSARLALALVAAALLAGAGCGPSVAAYRYPELPKVQEGAAHFIIFNVGQADSMLVLHGGKSMLIDAGVSRNKRARSAFRDIPKRLEALTGRRHLDYMVVTHYHADHVGSHASGRNRSLGELGLWGLLADEGVTIGTLIDRGFMTIGPKGSTQRAYERSLPGWLQRAVRRRVVAKMGMTIDMGPGMRVEVVSVNGAGRLLEIRRSRPGFFDRYPPSENDYSIALKFTQGDFELFTGGDLTGQDSVRRFGSSAASYNDIESRIAQRVGDVEVYRVDHHGSDHSSNPCFIKVLDPEVSIFSTGENGYGHPSARVYDSLRRLGRVIITGGASRKVYYHVKKDIAFSDVEVLVVPSGKYYYVEGTRYRSLSEAEERARPDYVDRCPEPPEPPASQPERYERYDADPPGDAAHHRGRRRGVRSGAQDDADRGDEVDPPRPRRGERGRTDTIRGPAEREYYDDAPGD